MPDNVELWEYYVEYLPALAEQEMPFVQQFYARGPAPMYAVQSILPRLNQLGAQGWELVQMDPVKVGNNGDIMVFGPDTRHWTNIYLCSFKRRRS